MIGRTESRSVAPPEKGMGLTASTVTTLLCIAAMVFAFTVRGDGLPATAARWLLLVFSCPSGVIAGMPASVMISAIPVLSSSNEGNGIPGRHEYKITSDGLDENTRASEGLCRWEGIREVRVSGPFILVGLSGYLLHAIPKRGWKSRLCIL